MFKTSVLSSGKTNAFFKKVYILNMIKTFNQERQEITKMETEKKAEKAVQEVKEQKQEIKELKREVKHLAKLAKLKDGTSRFITGFKQEMRANVVTAVTAAFGFLIALVWRDFIVQVINKNMARFGLSQETIIMQFYAAVIVTIVSVIGIMLLSKGQSANK